MSKYIALSQREIHTAPLPQRVEPSEYREPQFLWVYSLIALGPDSIYVHGTTYSVKPSYEQANDAGWLACLRDYPESEGFTRHSVSMSQVHPRHVAKATGGLA